MAAKYNGSKMAGKKRAEGEISDKIGWRVGGGGGVGEKIWVITRFSDSCLRLCHSSETLWSWAR